jgi:hypothetical protein
MSGATVHRGAGATALEALVDDRLRQTIVVQHAAPRLQRFVGRKDHRTMQSMPLVDDVKELVVVAPRGRLVRALRFTIANGKITEIEVIGNPARLGELDVSTVE